MDPRDRADAVLARAQARKGVVTPDNMTSPMDSVNTQQIPRAVVQKIDSEVDPNTTTKLPSSVIEANDVSRESHLSETMPTTPMRTPLSEQPDVTQPVSIPSSEGSGDTKADAQAESRTDEDSDDGGLVPTTKTTRNQSYVARRLEGL
ncbi:hypothetical protein [Saccharomonospora glauca]|uniref:Uncharacterized protein n=1 Tax=Saccharomonospora glauca K62 TaxID=928724 RepID=I1CY56_9PSEU|nr:hypothetical protein [Saccharomonospora glauca]EIE97630.1 hypothetical protein SacglDRAFT_00684 [Saccharomonospora glauca K62]